MGTTCRWQCGTSRPATIKPIRAGLKPAICALPMACAVSNKSATSPVSRSTQWSISARGTTSAWPGRNGRLDRNTTHDSSFQTYRAGSSPAMILLKMLGRVLLPRFPVEEPYCHEQPPNAPGADHEEVIRLQARSTQLKERPDQRVGE